MQSHPTKLYQLRLREEVEPFYIGITRQELKSRRWQHFAECKAFGHNGVYKTEMFRAIVRDNKRENILIELLAILEYDQAFETERELIYRMTLRGVRLANAPRPINPCESRVERGWVIDPDKVKAYNRREYRKHKARLEARKESQGKTQASQGANQLKKKGECNGQAIQRSKGERPASRR